MKQLLRINVMSMFQAPGKGEMSKAQPQMSVSSFVSEWNSSVRLGEENQRLEYYTALPVASPPHPNATIL